MATFIFPMTGDVVTVGSAAELVAHMHATARTPAADDRAYMLDVADRTLLQDGGKLRTGSAEEFVNDLIAHKFVQLAHGDPVPPPQSYKELLRGRVADKCGGKECGPDFLCSCRVWALECSRGLVRSAGKGEQHD